METKEYTYRDKTLWGKGKWQDEPDKIQWKDKKTGLPCLIVRGPSGSLCGYVGVSKGHPAFEEHYDAVDVDVHGGLTFSNHCRPSEKEHGICHVVEKGEDDKVWWLGFDCAHCGDYSPSYGDLLPKSVGFPGEHYRDMEYVKRECRNLAAQLKKLSSATKKRGGR